MIDPLLRPGWRGNLLGLLSGALLTLSFAPFGLWLLGLLALALYHGLLQQLLPWQAARRSFWFGLGLFSSGTSWVYVSIHIYGAAPVPLAALLTGLFCLGLALFFFLFGYVYARWLRTAPGGPVLGFAGAWVLMDWLRSWLLTGFPWLYPGYAYLDTPLAGWAPIGGVWLVSFAVLASAGVLAQWVGEGRLRWANVAWIAGFWLGGWGLAAVEWTTPKGEPLRVAMVQANIPQAVKWDPAQFRPTLALYQQMSEPLWKGHDLVIWPEAAIPGYFQGVADLVHALQAEGDGAALLAGTPWLEQNAPASVRPGGIVYNSAVVVDGRHAESGRWLEPVYHKQHLVPFGEYVPLESWLRGLIAFFDLPMSSFSEGPRPQKALDVASTVIAPAICYEVVYPEQLRQFLPGAELLLTISNDAWFGRSIGPHQHMQMAQMRALEHGREMIRSTGNGITALVDHRGRIRQQLPQFERAVLSGEVQPYQGRTPFTWMGTTPWIAGLTLLVVGMARRAPR